MVNVNENGRGSLQLTPAFGKITRYNIPGEAGSIEPGKRLLNFCWYTNASMASLDEIMTDKNCRRHHSQLAPGQVRSEVWEKQKKLAKTLFAEPYLEVIEKIDSPFLHQISDYCSPRASVADGKILLVGDAIALLRPHIAFSTNQAAYHTFLTEKLLKGELTMEQWEYQVSTAAYLHWRRSLWFGEFFQRPLYISMASALPFWITSALAKARIWLGWLPPQAV